VTSPPKDGPSRQPLVVASIGLGAVAVMALLASRSCSSAPKATAPALDAAAYDDTAAPVPVSVADPMWGKRDAPVTIVMFASFQCPYSARAQPDLKAIEDTLGPEKLRLVWKTFVSPTHDKARPVALAGIAVHMLGGSEAFFKFHDTAFRNQAFLGPESYSAWGGEAGVDGNKVRMAEHEPAYAAKLAEDAALAKRLGVTRTPTYFVNGVELEGPVSKEKLEVLVKAELVKAEAQLAAGTPRDKLYVEATRKNTKAP